MKTFSPLLRTTALSLLLICTLTPNLAHAMEDGEGKDIVGTTKTARTNAKYSASSVLEALNNIAPEHRKAFINGFIETSAEPLENAAHNLILYTGGRAGEEIGETLSRLFNKFQGNETKKFEEVVKIFQRMEESSNKKAKETIKQTSLEMGELAAEITADTYIKGLSLQLENFLITKINYKNTDYSPEIQQQIAANNEEYDKSAYSLGLNYAYYTATSLTIKTKGLQEKSEELTYNGTLMGAKEVGAIAAGNFLTYLDNFGKNKLGFDKSYKTPLTLVKVQGKSELSKIFREYNPAQKIALFNSFVEEAAPKIETALHNLTVHYGAEFGKTVATRINDLLVSLGSEKVIEWQLAKLINFTISLTANAILPGSSIALDTKEGEDWVKKPVRNTALGIVKPATKAVSTVIRTATKPASALIGKTSGGITGEVFAEEYVSGLSTKLNNLLRREELDETVNPPEDKGGIVSSLRTIGAALGIVSTPKDPIEIAKNTGSSLACQYMTHPLDQLGEKIGFNNYHILKPTKKLTLTQEKSRSNVLKMARLTKSGIDNVTDTTLNWTVGWFTSVKDFSIE